MVQTYTRNEALYTEIERVSREDFIDRYWFYEAGQHVTILGPTGCGKTTLAYQLLDESTDKKLPGVILITKPRDETITTWTKKLGYKKIQTWPPVWKRRRGYVLWPKQSLINIEADERMLEREFKKVLQDCYRRGNYVIFADETAEIAKELHQERLLNQIWMRGRSMGCGLWASSQRPFHIPLNAYAQAEHLFLFKDPDQRNRQRFREIGGVDSFIVEKTVMNLDEHECLHIQRNPLGLEIIGP